MMSKGEHEAWEATWAKLADIAEAKASIRPKAGLVEKRKILKPGRNRPRLEWRRK